MSLQDAQIPNRRAFDNWKVVGPLPRAGAFLIDSLITFSAVWAVTYFTHQDSTLTQTVFFWILVSWAWEGLWLSLTGTSPGRRVFGISIYSPRTDGVPHPVQVCLRILTFWISILLFFTGLTPILFRRDRRGWHDLISETLTVGPDKDMPSAFMQQFGQGLLLVQSLAVFSTVGALLLSTGTGQFVLRAESGRNIECDSRDLLINNTAETLVAIAVSPAWHDCVPRLMSSLGALSDSQLARMALLSAKYHELWTISENLRPSYYQNEISSLEDQICQGPKDFEDVCKTARHLASVAANTESQFTEMSWLKEYEPLVRSLNREFDGGQRVEILKSALKTYKSHLVKAAIQDRLWVEQVALGVRPDQHVPHSLNPQWNTMQECWSDALGVTSLGNCQDQGLSDAVHVINTMVSENNSVAARDQLSRLSLGSHEAEFDVLVDAWKAKESGQTEEFHNILSRVPRTSPLRKIASQMAAIK